MKKYILSICIALGGLLASCSDDIDLVIPHATNITFSELEIPTRFSHVIPDGGFSVEGIHFNTVKSSDGQLSGGFCYSNRSNRSFVWQNTPEAIDSIRYSVWTTRPNNTGVYLVCHVNDDDASFTFDEPSVIDYILVANTTWAYLAMYYGDTYAGEDGEPMSRSYSIEDIFDVDGPERAWPVEPITDRTFDEYHFTLPESSVLRGTHLYETYYQRSGVFTVIDFDVEKIFPEYVENYKKSDDYL